MNQLRVDKINTLKLSGTGRILGIDVYKDKARVVELKVLGGTLNKYRANYRAVNYFTTDFPTRASIAERGELLAGELKRRGVKTRFCVSAIRSGNSRSVIADIPRDGPDEPGMAAGEIRNWIRENYEKLIRVPVPLKEVSFDFDVVSIGPDSIRCEVAFVRISERDEVMELLTNAGLHLINLGLGVRDCELTAQVADPNFALEDGVLIFAGQDELDCTVYDHRVAVSRKRLQVKPLDEAGEVTAQSRQNLVTGPRAEMLKDSHFDLFTPFNLLPEYALAAGLAIRGFLPDLGAFDFRSEGSKAKSLEERDRRLFKMSAVFLGSVLFALLAGRFGIQTYLEGANARLEARLSRNGPVYTQVMTLESQVSALRNELDGQAGIQHRSNVAMVIHDIAENTPNGVWLYRLVSNYGNGGEAYVNLYGYAETNGEAASYLGELQMSPTFANVQVIRVGAPRQSEQALFNGKTFFVTFEVKLTVTL